MSLTNYVNLQAALKSALHRSDLDGSIPDFIALAEDKLNRRLRLRAMETRVQASVTSEYASLPDDFLAMRNFQLNTSPRTRLEYATPEYLDSRYPDSTATGQPKFYTLVGGEIQFAPIPGGAYTAELDYYAKLDLASDSTNWVLTNAPRVYFYGAMAAAFRFMKDDKRAIEYETLQDMAIADVEKADERDQYPDYGLQMRSDTGAPA